MNGSRAEAALRLGIRRSPVFVGESAFTGNIVHYVAPAQELFEFLQTHDAAHAWRYPDLSSHVRYLSQLLRQTVEHEMAEEAQALRRFDAARAAIKDVVEMPDQDADRIIRSLRDSHWQVSNKLRRELPQLFAADGALHSLHWQLVEQVRAAFEQDASAPGAA